jgi:hypothetical protein
MVDDGGVSMAEFPAMLCGAFGLEHKAAELSEDR